MKPNASLLYTPTNDIRVKTASDGWHHMRFLIHDEEWELSSISLNRGSFIIGKLKDPKEGLYGTRLKIVKKLTADMGVIASRWGRSIQPIANIRHVTEYVQFWDDTLRRINPKEFNDTKAGDKVVGVGSCNGSPMLMMKKEHNILISPSSLVHLEYSVQGSSIKQQYIYLDDENRVMVPLADMLRVMDADFGRFADPYDENPNKTLSGGEDKRLLTFHFEESFKEE
jgi:hypothetical protein